MIACTSAGGASGRSVSSGRGVSETCFTSIAGVFDGAERRRAGEHLVADDAERVDVAAAVELALADRLLGRHVRRRAHGDAGDGEPRVARGGARDAEVGDHGAARRAVEQDVVGLHVAMHDAARVRVRERVGHVGEDAPRVGDRQAAARASAARARLSPSTSAMTK